MIENQVIIITTVRECHALHSWLEAMEQKETVSKFIKSRWVTPPFTDGLKLMPDLPLCYRIDVDGEVTWDVSTPEGISVIFAGSSTVVHHRGDIEAQERAHVKCQWFNDHGCGLPQDPGTVVLRGRSSLETMDMANVKTHVIAHDCATWRSHGR